MDGMNQFVDSIFEPRSFLLLWKITLYPISNFFVYLCAARGKNRDTLADFDIATSNSLAKSVLKATNSSWGGSITNLGWILKSTSKGDFTTIKVVFRIPRVFLQDAHPNLDPRR